MLVRVPTHCFNAPICISIYFVFFLTCIIFFTIRNLLLFRCLTNLVAVLANTISDTFHHRLSLFLGACRSQVYMCERCPKFYRSKTALRTHTQFECGKEKRFKCPYCDYRAHLKGNLQKHVFRIHLNKSLSKVDTETM